MIIKELSEKTATVELSYDEIRCISNSLFYAKESGKGKEEPNFPEVYADITTLFALIKHRKIPDFELKLIYETIYGSKEEQNV